MSEPTLSVTAHVWAEQALWGWWLSPKETSCCRTVSQDLRDISHKNQNYEQNEFIVKSQRLHGTKVTLQLRCTTKTIHPSTEVPQKHECCIFPSPHSRWLLSWPEDWIFSFFLLNRGVPWLTAAIFHCPSEVDNYFLFWTQHGQGIHTRKTMGKA